MIDPTQIIEVIGVIAAVGGIGAFAWVIFESMN